MLKHPVSSNIWRVIGEVISGATAEIEEHQRHYSRGAVLVGGLDEYRKLKLYLNRERKLWEMKRDEIAQ
mgnify:CR=1 FL=1